MPDASKNNKKDLFDSERRFRLLVEGVIDYAIYMLDPTGIITNWNAGRRTHQGLHGRRNHRPAFLAFYTPEDREAGFPRSVARDGQRSTGKFEAEGWRVRKDGTQFLASVVIDADPRATASSSALPKSPATSPNASKPRRRCARASSQFRLLVRGVTDYALYMLESGRHRHQLERRRASASRDTRPRKSSASISRASTPTRTAPPGVPARALQIASDDRALRRGRLAGPQGRHRSSGPASSSTPSATMTGELIGFAKITRDITERREAQEKLEQVAASSSRIAEDGGARPADRRRRARLQQSPDDRQRQRPDAETKARTTRKRCGRFTRSRRRPSAEPPDTAASDLLPAAKRQPVTDRHPGPHPIDRRRAQERPWQRDHPAIDMPDDVVARHGRCNRIRDRAAQSGHQRARRHDRWRTGHREGAKHQPRQTSVGAICCDFGRGYRPGYSGRYPGEGVRSVLHHQTRRKGNRPRTLASPRLCPSGRRPYRHRERTRPRHRGHDLSSAHRDAERQG